MEHFNGLTPAEAERLAIMAEECAEVIQVIGKIQRHGFDSKHPDGGVTNRQLLEKELGDVRVVSNMLEISEDIDVDQVAQHAINKHFTLPEYLHHNRHLYPDYHYKEGK